MNHLKPEISVEWRYSAPNATACTFDGKTLNIITGNKETALQIMNNLHEIRTGIRKQVAEEIEEYRVDRCRCGPDLEKDCEALQDAIDIANGVYK